MSFPLLIIALGATVAVIWYAARAFPAQLEADGQGRLPSRFVATALFVAGNLFVFAVLVMLVHLGFNLQALMDAVENPAGGAARFETLLDAGAGEALSPETVFSAAAALFGLFGLRRWREIEAGALRQLHQISLVPGDERKVRERLRDGRHQRSDAHDAAAKLAAIEAEAVRAGAPTRPLDIGDKHAKLSALLDLLARESTWTESLPNGDRPQLEVVAGFVARKSRLADNVTALVARIRNGGGDPAAIRHFIERLDPDTPAAEALLNQLERKLEGEGDPQAVEAAVGEILRELVDYLHEEYDEKLDQMIAAAARCVMMAGDGANDRLKALEDAGFGGLGRLPVLSLDTAIFLALAVGVGVGVVFAGALIGMIEIGRLPPGAGTRADAMATVGPFVGVMTAVLTIATLVGVMVGGLRNLALRVEEGRPPWSWWILASAMASLAGFAVLIGVVASGWLPLRGGSGMVRFATMNALLPFALTLAICWFGSQPAPRLGPLTGRTRDALLLGAAMLGAAILMVLLGALLGATPPGGPEGGGRPPFAARLIVVGGICFVTGGVIGGLVLGEVRRVAMARILTPEPARPAPQPDPEPAIPNAEPA